MAANFETALQAVVGLQLSHVTFVEDYWQLAFDGPMLTVLSTLSVIEPEESTPVGDPEFRNKLCYCIGRDVQTITFLKADSLTIAFQGGIKIVVSLLPEDYRGPEAIHFWPQGPGHVRAGMYVI